MEVAARQLIRAVRGPRSQVALSRQLGYRGNPVADWEAGRRFLTAHEFCRLCVKRKLDVSSAFHEFHPSAHQLITQWQEPELHLWLDAIRGGTSAVTLGSRSGHSRHAVGRWLNGKARPRLPEFLSLIEAATGRASDLVASLVDIEEVPALAQDHRARVEAKRLAFEHPWSEAILRLIETPNYQKTPTLEWLANVLGVEQQRVQAAVQAMLRAGVIRKRNGRLVETVALTVDTRDRPEKFNRLRAHWTQVARQRLESPGDDDWLSYNVFSVSEEEMDQVRDILRNAYREIRSLAAASKCPEKAALLNMQLLLWD